MKAKILFKLNVLSIEDRGKKHDIYIKDDELEEVMKLLMKATKKRK